jgi:hypothetical protein
MPMFTIYSYPTIWVFNRRMLGFAPPHARIRTVPPREPPGDKPASSRSRDDQSAGRTRSPLSTRTGSRTAWLSLLPGFAGSRYTPPLEPVPEPRGRAAAGPDGRRRRCRHGHRQHRYAPAPPPCRQPSARLSSAGAPRLDRRFRNGLLDDLIDRGIAATSSALPGTDSAASAAPPTRCGP